MTIGCVILAGGQSSRMGRDKALLPVGDKNFITQLTEQLSFFPECLLARGALPEIPGLSPRWRSVPDLYPHQGPLSGIHCALASCSADALLVVTCDMPNFRRDTAELLCRSFAQIFAAGESCDALVCTTPDGRTHPLCGIYHRSALPVLSAQLEAGENKVLLALQKLHTLSFPLPEEAADQLRNINSPTDFAAISRG